MIVLLFVVHVLIAIALVGVVLLQKSEGGALGMGGGGMSGFMTGRSTANLLTRTTAVLGGLFFLTSIFLVVFSNAGRAPRSMVDEAPPGPVAPLEVAPPAPPVAAALEPGPVTLPVEEFVLPAPPPGTSSGPVSIEHAVHEAAAAPTANAASCQRFKREAPRSRW